MQLDRAFDAIVAIVAKRLQLTHTKPPPVTINGDHVVRNGSGGGSTLLLTEAAQRLGLELVVGAIAVRLVGIPAPRISVRCIALSGHAALARQRPAAAH